MTSRDRSFRMNKTESTAGSRPSLAKSLERWIVTDFKHRPNTSGIPASGQSVRSSSASGAGFWSLLLAAVWLISFSLLFAVQELPNNAPTTRLDLWFALPYLVLEAIAPSEPAANAAGWMWLPQRLPLWSVGLTLVFGGMAWGSLALRILVGTSADSSAGDSASEHTVPTSGWCCLAGLTGLSLVSLVVLGLGKLGVMSAWPLATFLLAGIAIETRLIWSSRRRAAVAGQGATPAVDPKPSRADVAAAGWRSLPRWQQALALMVIVTVGGSMFTGCISPQVDFDVKEYHLNGPKEYFQAGQIGFLPHNVYTSFPFLCEMLLLAGMMLMQDWYWGGLAGQVALMAFAPLTACGLWSIGRRIGDVQLGYWAALMYLVSPWVYRLTLIAYVEGPLCGYVLGAWLAAWQLPTGSTTGLSRRDLAWSLVAGFLAGSAMACKYPGLLMVVVPMASLVHGRAWRHWGLRGMLLVKLAFAAGVVVAIGPWLLKNLLETGNPVYPLLYSVFDGRDWDRALDEKWRNAHSSQTFSLNALLTSLTDVFLKNDWQSPLWGALVPLAWLRPDWLRLFAARTHAASESKECEFIERDRSRLVWEITAYLVVQYLVWWALTHRLDRFWVPMTPLLALLAGVAVAEWSRTPLRWLVQGLVVMGCVFIAAFCCTSLGSYHVGWSDLNSAREFTARLTAPEIEWINRTLAAGPGATPIRVLCVGEAETFDARFPVRYNTVFDHSLFEQWVGDTHPDQPSAGWTMQSPAEIRQRFAAEGITHVLVNWAEISRYRDTYGYTKFVTPSRFTWLIEKGILGPPLAMEWPLGLAPTENMSADALRRLEEWAPELLTTVNGQRVWQTSQLFPVTSSPNPSRPNR